jgi:hypothetical protein
VSRHVFIVEQTDATGKRLARVVEAYEKDGDTRFHHVPGGEPKVPTVDPLPIGICGLYLRRLGSETSKTRVFSEVKHGIGKT